MNSSHYISSVIYGSTQVGLPTKNRFSKTHQNRETLLDFDALSVVATASRPATAKSVRPFDPALHPQPWPFPVEMAQQSHGLSSLVPPGTLPPICLSTDIPWDISTQNFPGQDRPRHSRTPVTTLHQRNPPPQHCCGASFISSNGPCGSPPHLRNQYY